MKKVLFLVQLPPPVHGVSIMNQIVTQSTVITAEYARRIVPIQVANANADIGVLSPGKVFRTACLFMRLLWGMLAFRPALVYFTFSPVGLNVYRDCLLLLLVKCFRPKVLLHLHGVNIRTIVSRSRILAKVLRRVFVGVNVICLSRRLVDDITPVYTGAAFIVPNTIEYDPQTTGIARAPKGKGRILFLSNLQIEKGVDVFLDALSILRSRGATFDAHLVGNPFKISLPEIREEIRRRDLSDRVIALGGLGHSEKYRQFAEADILVFPSRNEAFGLVLLEAAAWGIPVVASGVGALRDIVRDGINGFVIDDYDPAAYAAKIEMLLGDSRLREDMGQRARQIFYQEYSLRTFERNLRSVFLSVLPAGSGEPS